jgi:hypothetical protein
LQGLFRLFFQPFSGFSRVLPIHYSFFGKKTIQMSDLARFSVAAWYGKTPKLRRMSFGVFRIA